MGVNKPKCACREFCTDLYIDSWQMAQAGPPRGFKGPRANTKSGAPQNGLSEGGGSGGTPPGNFEI